jgi:membrane fusion protein (multidrug efflux system)
LADGEPLSVSPETISASSPPAKTTLQRLAIPLGTSAVACLFVVLATAHWNDWIGGFSVQTTNDSYVRAQTTKLKSRVAGAVKLIAVDDFEHVQAGDLLMQIDPADYDAQVAQAAAALAAANAALDNLTNEVELQYAIIAQAEAQRGSALALQVETQQERERQQSLTQTDSGTRQKFEQAVASYAKAQADVKANAALIAEQRHKLEVLAGTKKQRAADVLGAQAALDAGKLRLSYTTIFAPFDGTVGERLLQPGDYVNVGTSLIDVVPLPNVYVIANFKETQLSRVQTGLPADIIIDAFPGQTIRGHVARVSPASGSQFALLPPDNATGNFTKVVQRVSVRLELDPGQPLISRLLPGMSATTRIHLSEQTGSGNRGAK